MTTTWQPEGPTPSLLAPPQRWDGLAEPRSSAPKLPDLARIFAVDAAKRAGSVDRKGKLALLAVGRDVIGGGPWRSEGVCGSCALDLKDGKVGMEIPFAGGKALDCRYQSKDAKTPSLRFKHTVMNNPAAPENVNYFKSLAGKMQKVAGDPDGAMWQANQGDNTNATLVYLRKGVIVEARVTETPRDSTFEATKAKLLKLRRVP